MDYTPKRIRQLERLLRKLRERAFECQRAAAMIDVVKARLAETWAHRAHSRNQYHWMYAAE